MLRTYQELDKVKNGMFSPFSIAAEVAKKFPMAGQYVVSTKGKGRRQNANKKVEFFCLRPGATTYYSRNPAQLRKEGFGKKNILS